MIELQFFVIEGDNGTGKDSLAQKFQAEGFKIITYDSRIKKFEEIAKSMNGKNKVLHFMAYNKACGELAKEERQTNNVILIRYFISSLAAAYSDGVFSYEETMKLLDKTYSKFEKPDVIIRLKCDNKERIRRIDFNSEYTKTKAYWRKYVKDHDTLQMPEEDTEFNRKLNKVYKRTILLFPLLTNQEVGGISAAIEVDENITKCGKYAYCWPRDAVFVTRALDILNMTKETEKFYKVFCKNTQSENGMWEQRFYTDGKLAPCWGYQIDETASVIYGVNEHYKKTKEIKFLNKFPRKKFDTIVYFS